MGHPASAGDATTLVVIVRAGTGLGPYGSAGARRHPFLQPACRFTSWFPGAALDALTQTEAGS